MSHSFRPRINRVWTAHLFALKLAEQGGEKNCKSTTRRTTRAAEDAARLLKERGAAPLVIKADIGRVVNISCPWDSFQYSEAMHHTAASPVLRRSLPASIR